MNNRRQLLIDLISAAFIVLYIYAAVSKLLDYEKFQVQLSQSPLLNAWAGTVAWAVPAIEIVIAALLTFGRVRLLALYSAFTLIVLFTAYIITITRFSDYVPCSCGGVLSKLSWNQHLVFNLVFVLLGMTAILLYEREHRSDAAA